MILSNSNSGQQGKQTLQVTGKAFRLTLLRHGQTNHNRLRLVQGQMDTQLNDFGREQASLLARYLKRIGIHHDQIFTSDLSRAYETSRLLCAHETKRAIAIKKDSLLRERSYGKLQGLPMSTIRKIASTTAPAKDTQEVHCVNASTPTANAWAPYSKIYQPEGGETLDQVRARVEAFCDQVLFPQAGHHQHILVVSHGGTIREFMKVFKYKYGALIPLQDLVMSPNTGVNEFDIWLNERLQVAQIRTNHLHKLPHLTFDVFNRDNPHVNLNNLHLRRAMDMNVSDKQDLRKLDQLSATQLRPPPPPPPNEQQVHALASMDLQLSSIPPAPVMIEAGATVARPAAINAAAPTGISMAAPLPTSLSLVVEVAPSCDSMNSHHHQQQVGTGGGCSNIAS